LDAGVEIDAHRRMRRVACRHRLALALGEAAVGYALALGRLPEFGFRVARDLDRRLVGGEQLGHHLARGLGPIGLRLHLHAGRRHADAARGEHALALDLDHADAAIAVGAIAWLRRVAQMRQLDVEAARGAEDRFTLADVDLAIVDEEGLGRRLAALADRLVGRRGVRDARLAAADGTVERFAFVVVSVADGLPGVVAHRITSL